MDEGPGIGVLECLNHFSFGSSWLGEEEVVSNSGVEQHWLLANVADLMAHLVEIECLQVVAVNHDLTLVWVIEPFEQLDDGRLP